MKKIFLMLSMLLSAITFAQVGIGTNTPSAKSILDLTTTDKGFLLPRMTTAQRAAIAPTATTDKGMQVFDTTTNSIWFWDGTIWSDTKVGANNGVTKTANTIELGGALTKPTTVSALTDINKMSFTGTGVDAFNIDGTTFSLDATNNRVGIGTVSPTTTLDVNGSARIRTIPNGNNKQDLLSVDANGNISKRTVSVRSINTALNETVTVGLGSLITGSFVNLVCNDSTLGTPFTGYCILNYNGTFTSLHTNGPSGVTVTGNGTTTIRFSYTNGCGGTSFIQFSNTGWTWDEANVTITSDSLPNSPISNYYIR